jgi:hypothetical protein
MSVAHFGGTVEGGLGLCTKRAIMQPPPPGGWAAFLSGIELFIVRNQTPYSTNKPKGRLPSHSDAQSSWVLNEKKNKTNLDAQLQAYNILLWNKSLNAEYTLEACIGQGTYGTVWKLKRVSGSSQVPESLVLKMFVDPESAETAYEASTVDLMNAVDRVRGGESDRIPAVTLVDANNTPCIVMPAASAGSLPERLAIGEAFNVTRAACTEMLMMHNRYGLLCCDAKAANFLVDCAPGRTIVRAADYGGYAPKGRVCVSTFPVPWRASTMGAHSISQRVDEELAVYNLFAVYANLLGYTDELYYSALEKPGALDLVKIAIFNMKTTPGAPPGSVDFIDYACARLLDATVPPRTLAGAAKLLRPLEWTSRSRSATVSAESSGAETAPMRRPDAEDDGDEEEEEEEGVEALPEFSQFYFMRTNM